MEQRNAFDRDLLENISNLPGVQAAAIGNGGMPYSGWQSSYTLEGHPRVDGQKLAISLVSNSYLRTLGVPLKRGRNFTSAEVENGMHVALINESAARLFPAGTDSKRPSYVQLDVLGQPLHPTIPAAPGINSALTIIGVIGDTKNDGLDSATAPAIYLPYTFIGPLVDSLAVRTFGDPLSVLNSVRRKFIRWIKDGDGPPLTIDEMLGHETDQPRFNMALFTGFAASVWLWQPSASIPSFPTT